MTGEHEYTSQGFIKLIRQEVYSGHGFVPLIGSGMSAPSGILMGMEFSNYLAYTVWRVVEADQNGEHWNLRKDGWPRYPKDDDIAKVKEWTYETFEGICKARGFTLENENDEAFVVKEVRFSGKTDTTTAAATAQAINRPLIPGIIRSEDSETWKQESQAKELQKQFRGRGGWMAFDEGDGFSRTSNKYLKECAIRSMHDWRATLQFLSMTKCESDKRRTYLDDQPDASVVDGFNVHITRDRQINLGHKMISHLVRPMRIRTLLTTNFDQLIEQAFGRLLIPLQVISVSVKGGLPHPRTVRSQNTLVKLHGDSIETRADFTLDEEPSQQDKEW